VIRYGGSPLTSALMYRGIHQPKPAVRQRVFYLFSKFVKDVKSSIEPSFVPAILGSMGVSSLLV
jgi:hypothetical protein